MTGTAQHKLEELVVEEGSFVNRGMNQHAHVLLTKTVDEKGCGKMEKTERANLLKSLMTYLNMDITELAKLMKAENPEGEDVNKTEAEALQKKNDALAANQTAMMKSANAITAAVAEIGKAADATAIDAVVTKAKADITEITKSLEDEDVRKYIDNQAAAIESSATLRKGAMTNEDDKKKMDGTRDKLPEAMKKAFDAMTDAEKLDFAKNYNADEGDGDNAVNKVMKKMSTDLETTQKELTELRKRQEKEDVRKEFKDLEGKIEIDKFVDTVLTLRKSGAAGADDFIEQTRALVKQAEKGGELFVTIGKRGEGAGDADTEIAKSAATIKQAQPDLTDAQAIAKAYQDNPDLYTKYLEDNPSQRS